ncbi:substrate-binding domain-containing protein [Chitinophagaceae bacterium LWZ2-11]
MNKVSLKDVAIRAGVSTALVSYVLNGRLTNRISKEAAAKIKKAAKDLNYRPNRIAQSLKMQRTFTIGLIVADIANPFSGQIARVIEDEAHKKGYTVIIGSSDEQPLKSQALIDLFQNRQVDGFIIAPVENSEAQIKKLIKQDIPLVLIDRYFSAVNASSVTIDNYNASAKAVTQLITEGRKKIAVVAYKAGLAHLEDRLNGYRDTLKKNKLPVPTRLIGMVDENNIEKEVAAKLSGFLSGPQPADAVYFTTNKLALTGLKILNRLKVNIPEDLSVVCFDETDAWGLFPSPLTYIKQPVPEIASKAVELLTAAIDASIQEKKLKPIQIVLSSQLLSNSGA